MMSSEMKFEIEPLGDSDLLCRGTDLIVSGSVLTADELGFHDLPVHELASHQAAYRITPVATPTPQPAAPGEAGKLHSEYYERRAQNDPFIMAARKAKEQLNADLANALKECRELRERISVLENEKQSLQPSEPAAPEAPATAPQVMHFVPHVTSKSQESSTGYFIDGKEVSQDELYRHVGAKIFENLRLGKKPMDKNAIIREQIIETLNAELAQLRKEKEELEQMIAEDCCSKTEANQRIANAQREAASVFVPEIENLRTDLSCKDEQIEQLTAERDKLKQQLEEVKQRRDRDQQEFCDRFNSFDEIRADLTKQLAHAQAELAKREEPKWESDWGKLPKERCAGWVKKTSGEIDFFVFNASKSGAIYPHIGLNSSGSYSNYRTGEIDHHQFALITQQPPAPAEPTPPQEAYRELTKNEGGNNAT